MEVQYVVQVWPWCFYDGISPIHDNLTLCGGGVMWPIVNLCCFVCATRCTLDSQRGDTKA